MKAYSVSCAVFAAAGVATASLSAYRMGSGFWALAILSGSLVAGASAFHTRLVPLAKGIAGATAALSGVAIALGLLAGTIGGSLSMSAGSAILLGCFGGLLVSGVAVYRTAG